MPTYQEIADEVRRADGFTVKTCWIADVKSGSGVKMRHAWNKQGAGRVHPCPPAKLTAIERAIRRLIHN